jgi:Tol biopolymer transport system component
MRLVRRVAKAREVRIVGRLQSHRATSPHHPVKLLHSLDHVINVFNHMDRPQLIKTRVAKRVGVVVEIGNHICRRAWIIIEPHRPGILFHPAAHIQYLALRLGQDPSLTSRPLTRAKSKIMHPQESNPSNRQLESWKEIAGYLKTSVRTAQRWEEQNGLPVTRILRDKRSAVYANTTDLDQWLNTRTIPPAQEVDPDLSSPPRRFHLWLAVIPVCVIAAMAVFWFRSSTSDPFRLIQPVRLTSYPGIETQPVLSPDLRLLAFAFFHDGTHGIAIQAPNGVSPQRIFEAQQMTYSPQWSPDSRQLAFLVSADKASSNLMLYDTQSGKVRRIAGVMGHFWFDASVHSFPALQWTPDAKAILVADGVNNVATSLIRLNPDTLARSTIYTLPAGLRLRAFALSPSAQQIAMVIQSDNQFRLHTLNLDSQLLPVGAPKLVLTDNSGTESPGWLPNGDLIFIRNQRELWRVINGRPAPVPIIGLTPDYSLSAAADGRILWGHTELDTALTLYDPQQKSYGKTSCDSTTLERQPRLSPNGKQMLFNSDRNGFINLWVCDPNTNQLSQLTQLQEGGLWDGDWSPDSSRVAFSVNNSSRSVVEVVRVSDSKLLATVSGPGSRFSPTWSPDSKQVYFVRRANEQFHLQSYDLSSGVTRTHTELDRPNNILMRADGKFWLRSKRNLSLLALNPNLEQKVVATKLSNLVALTPDRLGAFFSRSLTGSLVGGVDFWYFNDVSGEHRITPPLPDSMGFAPGPDGWIYTIRATSTNSDIYSAALHAK